MNKKSQMINITFKIPLPVEEWLDFCADNNIEFSPITFGLNTFYYNAQDIKLPKTEQTLHIGDIVIRFGESVPVIDRNPNGSPDIGKYFRQRKPLPNASHLEIACYNGELIHELIQLVRKIVLTFLKYECTVKIVVGLKKYFEDSNIQEIKFVS